MSLPRALVLTAGLGTRLRPLTYVRAKAAVPVNGETLARRVVRWLAAQGVHDLVLNLHHLPATIAASVGDGSDLGARVRYSWEQPVLGSAGGPRRALPLLVDPPVTRIPDPASRIPLSDPEPRVPVSDPAPRIPDPGPRLPSPEPRVPVPDPAPRIPDLGPRLPSPEPRVPVSDPAPRIPDPGLHGTFIIVNGDTLTDVDIPAMLTCHSRSGAAVTMALIPNPRPEKYGGVRVSDDGWVTKFTRPGVTGESWHFIGVQIAEAEAFASLADGVPAETVNSMYPRLMAANPRSVAAFTCAASFRDIGTAADYLDTSVELASVEGDRMRIGRRQRIDDSARTVRTALWDDVTIGRHVELVECIVGDGASVPDGARYQRCAIMPAGSRTADAGERIEGGLLIKPID